MFDNWLSTSQSPGPKTPVFWSEQSWDEMYPADDAVLGGQPRPHEDAATDDGTAAATLKDRQKQDRGELTN